MLLLLLNELQNKNGFPPLKVGDEHQRKQHRILVDLHYGKAVKFFQLLKDVPSDLLRVQLERVAFAEFQMASK